MRIQKKNKLETSDNAS